MPNDARYPPPMRTSWPVVLRVAFVAFAAAFGTMHLVTVRHDETWGDPTPPQYGWPFAWTAWNGVSSMHWIVSPLPLAADLALHAAPFAILAAGVEWLVQRRPGPLAKVLRGALVVAAIVLMVPTLPTTVGLLAGDHDVLSLPSQRAPSARPWVGQFTAFADSPTP